MPKAETLPAVRSCDLLELAAKWREAAVEFLADADDHQNSGDILEYESALSLFTNLTMCASELETVVAGAANANSELNVAAILRTKTVTADGALIAAPATQ